MSIKTTNYVLNQDLLLNIGRTLETVPAGTFCKPVELCYVPKHVIQDERWDYIDPQTTVFCYTRVGFIPVPRSYLREI